MNLEDKRQLLALALSGNTEALRNYQTRRAIKNLDFTLIIDSRAVGGPIEVFEKSGARREMLTTEFEALPPQARASCVTIIDATGAQRIPDSDEDYGISGEMILP